MPTPYTDLTRISQTAEIVLRSGDASVPTSSSPTLKGAFSMQEVIADFGRMQPHPEIADGEIIPLGRADGRPDLSAINDNTMILLIEPENLQARGYLLTREFNGIRYRYGVVVGPVTDIHPETFAHPHDVAS